MDVWVPYDQRIAICGVRYSSFNSLRYSVTGV